MARTPTVERVLSSQEFKAWMPEKVVHLDRTIVRRPDIVYFISGLFGLSAGYWGFIVFGWPGVVALSLLGFLVALSFLIYLFGFRIDRIIRFTKENITVRSDRRALFESPWNSISAVHRVGKNGFEIESDSGKVTIWLPKVVFEAEEYGAFLKQILLAMSGEKLENTLARYPAPVILEPGTTYEYDGGSLLRRRQLQWLSVVVLSCLAICFSIAKQDYCGPVGPVLYVILGIAKIRALREETRQVQRTSISVQDGNLVVCQDEKTDIFANRILGGSLKPESHSAPFSQYEIYGDSTVTIRIDRRFLKQQAPTVNLDRSAIVGIIQS